MQNLLKLQTLEFGETKTVNNAEAAALRGLIPTPILAHYDRLRVHGKKGIVAVRNQVCGGCHMNLPLAVIMTLRHGDDVRLCDNCGRYLYLAEETQPVPEIVPRVVKPRKAAAKRAKAVAAV